jgi:hypothetical protein
LSHAAKRFNRRQTMLRRDFEAFYYCDDDLGDVALHHHDFYVVYLFLSGRVRYTGESRHYELAPGDILLISPQELHQPSLGRGGQESYARIVIWISAEFMRAMGAPYSCDLTRCFDVNSPAHANLLRLDAAARGPLFELARDIAWQDGGDPYGGLYSAVRLTELLIGLNRCRAGESERREQEPCPPDSTQAVAGYINAHLAERLTLDRLADVHTSPNTTWPTASGRPWVRRYTATLRRTADPGQTAHRGGRSFRQLHRAAASPPIRASTGPSGRVWNLAARLPAGDKERV